MSTLVGGSAGLVPALVVALVGCGHAAAGGLVGDMTLERVSEGLCWQREVETGYELLCGRGAHERTEQYSWAWWQSVVRVTPRVFDSVSVNVEIAIHQDPYKPPVIERAEPFQHGRVVRFATWVRAEDRRGRWTRVTATLLALGETVKRGGFQLSNERFELKGSPLDGSPLLWITCVGGDPDDNIVPTWTSPHPLDANPVEAEMVLAYLPLPNGDLLVREGARAGSDDLLERWGVLRASQCPAR